MSPYDYFTLEEIWDTLDMMGEGLWQVAESLSETRAEAAGEAARYGDSWPGSAIEISRIAACHARLEAEFRELLAYEDAHFPVLSNPPAPAPEPDPVWGDGGEPF